MTQSSDMSKYTAGSLFAPPPSDQYHEQMACVGTNGGPYAFDDFAFGYFDAARRLRDSIDEDDSLIDVLLYPLAFLYRQGMELSIKHLIYFLSPCYGGAAPKLTHSLVDNWKTVRGLLERHAADNPYQELAPAQLNGVELLIRDFEDFDPNSFVFRYPKDKAGEVYIEGFSRIDVAQLNGLMAVAVDWFESVLIGTREDMIV